MLSENGLELPMEGLFARAEAIHRLYFEKENLAENKKYIEENHKENLAQVFTDAWTFTRSRRSSRHA